MTSADSVDQLPLTYIVFDLHWLKTAKQANSLLIICLGRSNHACMKCEHSRINKYLSCTSKQPGIPFTYCHPGFQSLDLPSPSPQIRCAILVCVYVYFIYICAESCILHA